MFYENNKGLKLDMINRTNQNSYLNELREKILTILNKII